jgi:hypothetical protein
MAHLIPSWVKKEQVDLWVSESWILILLSEAHTPNAITQRYISDIIANEITDTGGIYTAGGIAVSGKVAIVDGNNYSLDLSDVAIGPHSTMNYRWGVLAKNTGNQATSPIRAHVDFKVPQTINNGITTIKWNDLGILYVA